MTFDSTVQNRNAHRNGGGWTSLLGSLVSFTAAASMFSFQQMQNAFTMLTDPRAGIERMTSSIDCLSKAMAGEWSDSSKRDVERKINQAVESMVDSTVPPDSTLRVEYTAAAGLGRKA